MNTLKKYTVTGGPKGAPVFGSMKELKHDALGFFMRNSVRYGDIIPINAMGRKIIQVNHPDLVKHVMIEHHKNYVKSRAYIRFETVLGKGLLTSNGEKWKQDRQKIQPMFKREQIEGYYFNVISQVGEKFKQRWLGLTQKSEAELDLNWEMSALTSEAILRLMFGTENLTQDDIDSLHRSYNFFMEYLKKTRTFPNIDLKKVFCAPSYFRFKRELANVDGIITSLLAKYKRENPADKYNMLALLNDAQKQSPEQFSEHNIKDHVRSMIFAGFETTSVLMQWMWYALDAEPAVQLALREEIACEAPSGALTHDAISRMEHLSCTIKETMRLYPSIWITSRSPLADDYFGDYKVDAGTLIVLPQLVMQRHPRWWDNPNAFMPERFAGEAEIDNGLYFPFSHGARKCSGFKLAEMEAKIIFATLLPLFNVKVMNSVGNSMDAGISLKLKHPLLAQISRR